VFQEKTMSEQISALIDDEIAIKDAAYLITMLQSTKKGSEAWSQYHLIGDLMRGDNNLSPNFKQNLMLQLDLEPTVLAPNATLGIPSEVFKLHHKVPTSWSIAASVSAVMVVGWMALHQTTQVSSDLVADAQVKAVTSAIPAEYLLAHQTTAPSGSAYYIQSVSYSQ
jgi:sigma-E factor negative regulatory protein RseA